MDISELKVIILDYLSRSDLDAAMEILDDHKMSLNRYRQGQLTMIRSNFIDVKNRKITGLISEEEFELERRKVTHNVLTFINELSEVEIDSKSTFFYDLVPYIVLSLILGVIFAVLIFLLKTL